MTFVEEIYNKYTNQILLKLRNKRNAIKNTVILLDAMTMIFY
jgi:hypothetical protein